MPSANMLCSFIKKLSASDTLRAHLLATDSYGNFLWCKSYHQSIAVSEPLTLGNGEYFLYSLNPKTFSNTTQDPTAFTVDQYGNSSCISKTASVGLTAFSSSATLNTFTLSPITLTLLTTSSVSLLYQGSRDTCGGVSLSLNKPVFNEKAEIWPNPSSGSLNISIPMSQNGSILRIFSVSGEKLKDVKMNCGEWDLSFLESGLYFLSVYYENGITETKKLIITRE